jgi:Xaa-Pro dipeptidase
MTKIEEIAATLAANGIDGWLFYDFRHSDPIAYRILGLDLRSLSTRRWFYLVPALGMPRRLVSAVEQDRLDLLPGERSIYRSADEMTAALAAMLAGMRRVAMNYSPECAIPYVSRVDGGTLELVRSCGVEVVTAADLIQRFEATLTPGELASHRRAAELLLEIVSEFFAEVARNIRSGRFFSESDARDFVLERITAHGLETHEPPIVAVNAHAAMPHFELSAAQPFAIKTGDLLLLDLWAREPDGIYADFTWMAYVGERVPEAPAKLFDLIARARDAAANFIIERCAAGNAPTGAEVDRVAREIIAQAGMGDRFVHRTGHSIGREVHANGANLDSLETRDHRELIDMTCFSIEPGVYVPGHIGLRTEINMTVEGGCAQVTTGAMQSEIVPIMKAY